MMIKMMKIMMMKQNKKKKKARMMIMLMMKKKVGQSKRMKKSQVFQVKIHWVVSIWRRCC